MTGVDVFDKHGQVSESFMRKTVRSWEDAEIDAEIIRAMQAHLNGLQLAETDGYSPHDWRLKLELTKHKIVGEFPPSDSAIQGEVRAFLYDDEWENLSALTPERRNGVGVVIMMLQQMVGRPRESGNRGVEHSEF